MPGRYLLLRRARTTDTITERNTHPKAAEPSRSLSDSEPTHPSSLAYTTGPKVLRSVINPTWTGSKTGESTEPGWLRGAWGSDVDSEEEGDDDDTPVFALETDGETTPDQYLLSTPVFDDQTHAPHIPCSETFSALPSWPEQEDEFEYDDQDECLDRSDDQVPYGQSLCSAVGSSYASGGPCSWASSPPSFIISASQSRKQSTVSAVMCGLRLGTSFDSLASYLSKNTNLGERRDHNDEKQLEEDDEEDEEDEEIDISEMSNGLVNFTLDHFSPRPMSSSTFSSPIEPCSPKSFSFFEGVSPKSEIPPVITTSRWKLGESNLDRDILSSTRLATEVSYFNGTVKSKAFLTSRIGSRRQELIAESRR
ncbi:hypothetical protein IAR55_006267 [Kwoniella newhampshirensis]|uniref:Uncharacterized protein n=1 Tax=Kwoniella newhampshirensis TaxID=1651941 RepID=A0AAW0YFI2_9TREE